MPELKMLSLADGLGNHLHATPFEEEEYIACDEDNVILHGFSSLLSISTETICHSFETNLSLARRN